MIIPKRLGKGSKVGLIAPSSPTDKSKLDQSIKALENLGYNVVVGDSCGESYGYLSGKDEIRAMDINRMFGDRSIDGIFCLRGGYGTIRIMSHLDYDLIAANPKAFIGYSDITTLHIAFNQLCNFVTYHGPMPSIDMITGFHDFSKESLIRAVESLPQSGGIKNPEDRTLRYYRGGKAEGTLIGGNLSLIVSTLGTPFEIDTKGKILFIEDIDEEPYSVDRMLSQLKLAGKLNDMNGLLIGDFCNCDPNKNPDKSLKLEVAIADILRDIDKPIIDGVLAGHCTPMITLDMGRRITMDGDNMYIGYV